MQSVIGNHGRIKPGARGLRAIALTLLFGILLSLWRQPRAEASEAPPALQVTGPTFTQQQKLVAGDGVGGNHFGYSVAISGETVVVGARDDDGDRGAAYVLVRSGTSWTEQQKLVASDGAGGDRFGDSVAISEETIVVGAQDDDDFRGSAYVFVRSGTSWTEQQKLTASDGAEIDNFGYSVAVSGETVVVSASFDDGHRGSAYVFVRNGMIWTERQKLTASDRAEADLFGFSAAISGDTIVVGAPFDDGAAGADQGSAYVFAPPTNTAPVASCRNVTVAAGSDCRAAASIDNGSFDPDADSITITQSPPGPYPLGKTAVELTVTDSFGASSSCSAVVKVEDQTAPVVKAGARKADNTPYIAGTWTDQTVTVRFDCSDFCSGIVSCPADVVLDATGVFALASGSATDGAGNKGSGGFGPIMIDKTPPVVSLTGVTPGAIYPLGAVPAAACNTTDAHSGVATAATLVVGGGNAQGVGTFNAGCVGATDKVGNRSPLAAFIYTVVYNMNKFVALAQEGVELEQRVSVLSGDVGARARSAGPFIRDGAEVGVGQEVEMLDPNSHLLGDSIFIRQRATVYNPSYNDLTNQGTILGAPVSPLTLSLIPALPALPAITPGTQNFEVEQQGTLMLVAGGYGALVARQLATITFTGGVYHFQSWDVGQQVKLHFLAPTEIRIAGRLRVDQRGYLGPAPSAPGLAARDIVIYVAGQNGQSGALGAVPEAAEFGQETTLNANVVVPNGTLRLRQRVEATGAFFGKWLRAGQQVKLTLDSRFGL